MYLARGGNNEKAPRVLPTNKVIDKEISKEIIFFHYIML